MRARHRSPRGERASVGLSRIPTFAVAAEQLPPRLKICGFAADAGDVTAIARVSRAKRAGFGPIFDGILERLCDLTAVQSVLGAGVVYMVWGRAWRMLRG